MGSDRQHPLARILFGWTESAKAGPYIFWGTAILSLLLILMEFILSAGAGEHGFRHPYFAMDSVTGFFAFWGFGSFMIVVLGGWLLGKFVRRDENYYGDFEEDGPGTEEDI